MSADADNDDDDDDYDDGDDEWRKKIKSSRIAERTVYGS